MRKNHLLLIALLLALVFPGCGCIVPPQPLSTRDWRPEVTISRATKKQIFDLLIAEMVGSGAQVKQVNEYSAVFVRRGDLFTGAVPSGPRQDSSSEMRISFDAAETFDGVRLVCNLATVTNPGSRSEQVADVTDGKIARDIQTMLDRLRDRLQP